MRRLESRLEFPRRPMYSGEYSIASGDWMVHGQSLPLLESRLNGLDICYSLGPYIRGSHSHGFSNALLSYRFGGSEWDGPRDRPFASLFGRMLAAAVTSVTALAGYRTILPIPAKKGEDVRGYHLYALVPEMVASLGSRGDGVTIELDVLQFERDVPEVKGLPLSMRHAVLANSITARSERVPSAGVLIVDDIIATGATLAEAARALRKVGVERVGCLSLAKRVA